MPVRHPRHEPQPARRSPLAADHVGAGPGRVDEHQAIGIECRLAADKLSPDRGDIGSVLLGRIEGLFLRVSLCALTKRQTVLSPTLIPQAEAASARRISSKVRSGCRATSSSTAARCSLSRERWSPPIGRARA